MMMQPLIGHSQIFTSLCRAHHKWGVSISFICPSLTGSHGQYLAEVREVEKAIPWIHRLSEKDRLNLLFEGNGFFLFDSEQEMLDFYYLTVGDDGPTQLNHYNGEMRVYALTCDPTGQLLSENT